MEAALPANSKVIVECTDPANLLTQIEPLLSDRLPLRNLHWKSPNRPLRSIDTLNVSFTRTDDGQSNAAFGQRRHQIPGLRQTPYVKIFLFRCDDKDTYKESGRKQIRHWIKNHTTPTDGKKSSNNQEYHDAFEWMIVHVVLPDTTAASEPRTSKFVSTSLGTTDSTDSVSSKSKWPGKSSSTIYEKLLADFNSSSKSPLDRVVQVRLSKTGQNKIPSVLSPADIEEQWEDLVEKLKVTILASFDTRVAQYEEDIKERDAQRSLPGWNFCTFFVLKEGLAKGFENVGLIDDAMAGYDELSAGLDAVVKEQAMRDEGDQGTLLSFSKEMKDKLRVALGQLRSEGEASGEETSDYASDWLFQIDPKTRPFDTRRKNYQDLILSNEVSALDLRTYIFSRQLELLRRRSGATLSTSRDSTDVQSLPSSVVGTGNMQMLAEIGLRGVKFINLAARAMRRDLYRAWGGQEGLTGQDLKTQRDVIDNVVGSWTWTAAWQLLELTNTPALDLPNDLKATTASLSRSSVSMHRPTSADGDSETHSQVDASPVPARPSTDQDMFTLETYTGRTIVSSVQATQVLSQREPSKSIKTGADQLASSRAEILLVARRVVERLGSKKGYIPAKYSSTFDDHSVHKDQSNGNSLGKYKDMLLAGIEIIPLQRVAGSAEAFSRAYEMLSDFSCRHFLAANKFKSAERAVVDLALMKYQSEDYTTAAEYFGLVANFYGQGAWSALTESVLGPYAACLKALDRRQEYVRCLLALITGTAQEQTTIPKSENENGKIQGYLDDLWSSSEAFDTAINVPLLSFFELNNVDDCVQHFDDRDSFSLPISMALRMDAVVQVPSNILLNLTAVDEEGPPKKLSLRTASDQRLGRTMTQLRFESKVVANSWFEFSSLEFNIGKIHFQLNMKDLRGPPPTLLGEAKGLARLKRPILLFPSSRSINVKAVADPFISLGQLRKINLRLYSNENDIQDCKISTKAATAGLRLRVYQTELVTSEDVNAVKMILDKDGDIRLSNIEPNTEVNLVIPYTLENSDTMLLTNLQITYSTAEGTFVYYESVSINTILPISVNVQEIFRANELLSRFTISPATLVPLRLKACSIDGGDQYDVSSGFEIREPWAVFPKQPASLVYRFNKKAGTQKNGKTDPLPLLVEYEIIDEIILSAVEERFSADIAETSFFQLSRLLVSHLLLAYKTKWTEQDLEIALLTQEIEIWPYEDIGWAEILIGIPAASQKDLIAWLQSWHSQQEPISFESSRAPTRRISIPIEIPTPRVVVTASVDATYHGAAVAVSQPFLATLTISFTDHWRGAPPTNEPEEFNFSYDLLVPPEQWLIGGRRKGNFCSAPHEEHAFQVLLLPQRAGHLMYPSLEIKCYVKDKNEEVHCEVDYQSVGMSVLVIAGLRSTTVAMDGEKEGAGMGGSFIVGSEKMDMSRWV
jgi:trafficking protein particle complex subunit 10